MNNTIILIKSQLINSTGINKIMKNSSKSERIKAGLFAGFILFVVLLIFVQMTMYAWFMADYFINNKIMDTLIIIGAALSILICLFMSIYKGSGYLFAFKDFDLLMSLPVSKSAILFSKLFIIVINNIGLSLLFGFPYLMIYGIKTSQGIAYYLAAILMLILSSLVPITVGSLLSLLLGKISSKSRHTNLLLIIGSFAVLALFMAVMMSVNSITNSMIDNMVNSIRSLRGIYYPFGLFTNGLTSLDLVSLLIFSLISILAFVLFICYFSKSFMRINLSMQEKYKISNYKMTQLNVHSTAVALLKKELSFYFSSHIYVVNTGFGAIMMPIITVLLIINSSKLTSLLNMLPANVPKSLLVTLSMVICVSLTCTTSPSVSLEGKNLWILKSLPIKEIDIFNSKIRLNILITAPLLVICSTILAVVMKFTLMEYLLCIAVGLCHCVLTAVLGLIINLHFPKLEWNTQVTVVKQSASVTIALFSSFLSILLPIGIFSAVMPTNIIAFQIIWLAAASAADILAYSYLKRKGIALFKTL